MTEEQKPLVEDENLVFLEPGGNWSDHRPLPPINIDLNQLLIGPVLERLDSIEARISQLEKIIINFLGSTDG